MEEKTTLELGLETIVDGVVKDGVSNVYSILTLEGISVRIKKLTWLTTTSKSWTSGILMHTVVNGLEVS
ncbi:hypothetical protein P8452_71199 [Trifolium repens]|nr:hypothetical protein P8452_71199 [Trifolium repens]